MGTYRLGGETLERVSEMRDLGVIVDEKLTFASQVDHMVRKACRALGVLIRSFQTGKQGRSFYRCDSKALVSTYCANVRSILEYGCVVWGGAAETHLKRLERVQHKFLMWLCHRCRITDPTLRYEELLQRFRVASLAGRRRQHDLLFIRNVHRQAIDSSFLLYHLPLVVPSRTLRRHALFYVPHARVNTVQRGLFCRIPRLCNSFLESNHAADVWYHSAAQWRRQVTACAFVNMF